MYVRYVCINVETHRALYYCTLTSFSPHRYIPNYIRYRYSTSEYLHTHVSVWYIYSYVHKYISSKHWKSDSNPWNQGCSFSFSFSFSFFFFFFFFFSSSFSFQQVPTRLELSNCCCCCWCIHINSGLQR